MIRVRDWFDSFIRKAIRMPSIAELNLAGEEI